MPPPDWLVKAMPYEPGLPPIGVTSYGIADIRLSLRLEWARGRCTLVAACRRSWRVMRPMTAISSTRRVMSHTRQSEGV